MENEVLGAEPCGCKVVKHPDTHMNPFIEYCPKHNSAQDLYEALIGLIEHYDIILVGDDPKCWVKAINAKAKAEGGK